MLSAIPNNLSISYPTYHNKSIDKNDNTEKEDIALKTETPDMDVSQEEQKQIQHLKARDQEVRTHEQAHLSAAGGLATGGASFSFQDGPDGISLPLVVKLILIRQQSQVMQRPLYEKLKQSKELL